MTKLFIKTYGCQMNEYDSEKILLLLQKSHGIKNTKTPETANIIILNTCSIRAKAEEKLFSDLGCFYKLKLKNPCLIIAVGGCVAVQEKENILKRAPYVDIIFGPQNIHKLPEILDKIKEKLTENIVTFNDTIQPTSAIEKFHYFPEPHAEGPVAFVSIMEGCNKFCSYCIVPYTRGREISRPVDDILHEINLLVQQDVKEITLLGQNVNDFKGKTSNGSICSLAELIHQIAKIDELKRIRFTTSHPKSFDDDLIETFTTEPKLVTHLHLPVQSGSDKILHAMRRGYTTAEYIEKIEKLRRFRPNISISSDFIVGFPGETENDFLETMNLINNIKFDHSFSFIYSPRPFTPAAELSDDVTMKIKKQRLEILQSQINKYSASISQAMVGTKQKIIITGKAKKNSKQLTGRTENNRVVNFIGDTKLIGQIVEVVITEALPNCLLGQL